MPYATGNARTGTGRRAYVRHAKGDHGLAVLGGASIPDGPAGPASTAAWARSVRRFARGAIWALPMYALAYGAATLGPAEHTGPAPFLSADRPVELVTGLAAGWLGLVAAVALAGLLAPVRSRRSAAVGLVAVLAGTALLLPVGGLPADDRLAGAPVRAMQWAALALVGAGWLLLGWAVSGSRLFNRGDGVLLMVAAPLLAAGGGLYGPLRTIGALLMLAAGIGIAWTAGRLVTAVPPPRAAAPA
ncbi:MAG TPA: hypothetical protein VHI50_04960 [Micromonosporaceae bacterium]|jgi:hypothetical protein|nr:hypothetical protein [Micromonosporaceae bacterium]